MSSASGLDTSVRTSRRARSGSVFMGNFVAPPEMRKMAITDDIGDRAQDAEGLEHDIRRPREIEDEGQRQRGEREDVAGRVLARLDAWPPDDAGDGERRSQSTCTPPSATGTPQRLP